MKTRTFAIVLALVIALLARSESGAQAASSFSLDWYTHNFPYSCTRPGLTQEGQANFQVNTVPIPTYSDFDTLREWSYGEYEMWLHAGFSGTLFRIGANAISIAVSTSGGNDYCTHKQNIVYLRGPGVDRLLFQFTREGTAFEGETDVSLGLREIDPNLADSLAALKNAIGEARAELRRSAQNADELAGALGRLAALEAAIDDLLERGFDDLTPEELDALLAAYDDLLPGVRDALVEFLIDLQRDVEELRREIERISEVFRQQVDEVDDVASGAPGWDPQDPDGFGPIEDGEFPPIDIPDVLGDEPWSSDHDPYADYADEVLAGLALTVANDRVVNRAGFVGIYQAWRTNIDTLELILQMRAVVSVPEWGAFLDAKRRVLNFLRRHIDEQGWINDAPIPPAVRAFVELLKDIDVAYRFKLRAQALQVELNMWSGALNDRQRAVLDTLMLLESLVRERLAQPAPEEEDGFWDTVGGIVDTAISFTPVGDFLDACRMITGREDCIGGRELTIEERALCGLGIVVGSGLAWKAAAGKVSAGAVGAVRKVGNTLDDLPPRRPRVSTPAQWSPIREEIPHRGGAVTYVHENGWRVKYDRRGFPDFSPHLHPSPKSTVTIPLSKSRTTDRRRANANAGFTDGTPTGYVWHHHHDLGKMQLVKEDVHAAFAHNGGFAVWKQLTGTEYPE